MKLLFYGLLALAIPGATFAEPLHNANSGALKNVIILVIRHAEQPDDGDSLSPSGEARAKAYVNYFKHLTIDGQPVKLDYLFAAAISAAVIARASPSNRSPRNSILPLTPGSRTNSSLN